MGTFDLKIKAGKQVFLLNYDNIEDDSLIKNIKNIRYIKLIIKESFGEDRTYINQVMLYENYFKEVNDYLKESIENTRNNLIKNINFSKKDFEDIMSSKNDDITSSKKDESYLPISQNTFNKMEKWKKSEEDKINDENIDIGNYYINENNSNNEEKNKENLNEKKDKDNMNITKNKKVKNIEQILKQNILENNTNRKQTNEEDKKYKTLYNDNNLNINANNTSIFNKKYPHTPNRFFINKNNDISKNLFIKQRHYSPNINNININDINEKENYINTKKNNNILKKGEFINYSFKKSSVGSNNAKNSPNEEKDYDNILQNQLKDMENQINLMGKDINISNNKNNKNNYDINNFSKSNNYGNNHIFSQAKMKYFKNDINDENDKNMNRTTYTKYNKYSPVINNKYSPKKVNNTNSTSNIFFIEENSKYKSPSYRPKNEKSLNNSDNQEIEEINNNYLPEYILKDLASNNTMDINRRLDNLEKNVNEIKKEISSMSSKLSNLSSNNFFQNNLKEQIKQICHEYLNEKLNSGENIKYNSNNIRPNYNFNNNNDNHSMYSEFMNDENKKFEVEMNKKIEQKMEIWGETLKNQIFNKLLKPSLNQIEDTMKKNIEEIKEKINEINNMNNINNLENINRYANNERYDKKNKMLESTNSDLFSKGTAKLRNEKYEEINRLGEKLYQKLLEKEKKLKLLKQETSKYIEENIEA